MENGKQVLIRIHAPHMSLLNIRKMKGDAMAIQTLNKILCPIDFSEPSYKGMAVAEKLALQYNSELVLLHVAPSVPLLSVPAPAMVPPVDIKRHQEEIVKEAEEKLQSAEKKLSKDINATMKVVIGEAADQIIKTAGSEETDLIVIATHGHTGWRRFMLGSVTERVIRNASCYVLSVPADQQ
jgi:nucleotide-binding universal stress UspA family protein